MTIVEPDEVPILTVIIPPFSSLDAVPRSMGGGTWTGGGAVGARCFAVLFLATDLWAVCFFATCCCPLGRGGGSLDVDAISRSGAKITAVIKINKHVNVNEYYLYSESNGRLQLHNTITFQSKWFIMLINFLTVKFDYSPLLSFW